MNKVYKYVGILFIVRVIVRVAGDQKFVVRKRNSRNIFEQVVTVAYQISLKTNCVEVSFLVKLHD